MSLLQSKRVNNGTINCDCGRPALRLTSHTRANPDRVFYKCTNKDRDNPSITSCSFWYWEDQLPASRGRLESPQSTQLLQMQAMFSQSHISPSPFAAPTNTPPATPRIDAQNQLATPQTNSRSPSRPHVSLPSRIQQPLTPSRMLSNEQRSRRLENIQRGVTEAIIDEDNMPARGIQTEPERLSPSLDDDDGHSVVSSAFTFKMAYRPCTPPPRSGASTITELPTPSSPTSYTRGGRRAISRASEDGLADSISMIGKGKQRMQSQDDTIASSSSTLNSADNASTLMEESGQETNMDVETETKGTSTEHGGETTAIDPIKLKVEGQLLNSDRVSLFSKAVEAMENTQKNMDSLNAIVQEMGQKEMTYQRDLEALEKQLHSKDELIKALQEKNALLIQKNSELEEYRSSIEQLHNRLSQKA